MAEDVFKCIPMKMEQFYEKFDKQCMQMPIFKYYDSYQVFQRISCASNEDIVLIKEKLVDRVERYQEQIEPEMKKLDIIVDSITWENINNQNNLCITLDRSIPLDIDAIVEATNIINPILDEADLIKEEYILDISSKERG